MAATQKARAVGFVSEVSRFAFDDNAVTHPHRRVFGRAQAPCRKERAAFRHGFGLHEQLLESGMRAVTSVRGERDFAIRSHFDFARALREVAQRHATNLGVVFRRDDDLGQGFDFAIATAERGAVGTETRVITAVAARDGLVRVRPENAVIDIAQINKLSPVVARGVAAPTRNIQFFPARITAARHGQGNRVLAVAQQVDARCGRVGT